MTAKGEVVPVLMASAPGGRDASCFHLFANTPAGGVQPRTLGLSLVQSAECSTFARFKLRVENSQPVGQVLLVYDAVEVFKKKR